MSEELRRRFYRDERVLIASSRILAPQFDDSLVCLTGAQIELLRNTMQYLNEASTFVATYYPGYYLIPDADALDAINAIVADLEETIMGCAELDALFTAILAQATCCCEVLGNLTYDLQPTNIREILTTVSTGPATQWLEFSAVPAFHIATVDNIVGYNTDGDIATLDVMIEGSDGSRTLIRHSLPGAYNPKGLHNPITVGPLELLKLRFIGTVADDNLYGVVTGTQRLVEFVE